MCTVYVHVFILCVIYFWSAVIFTDYVYNIVVAVKSHLSALILKFDSFSLHK